MLDQIDYVDSITKGHGTIEESVYLLWQVFNRRFESHYDNGVWHLRFYRSPIENFFFDIRIQGIDIAISASGPNWSKREGAQWRVFRSCDDLMNIEIDAHDLASVIDARIQEVSRDTKAFHLVQRMAANALE